MQVSRPGWGIAFYELYGLIQVLNKLNGTRDKCLVSISHWEFDLGVFDGLLCSDPELFVIEVHASQRSEQVSPPSRRMAVECIRMPDMRLQVLRLKVRRGYSLAL